MNGLIVEFRGELAALAAACIWAISSAIYAGYGRQLPPTALNLTKGMVAIALILLTLWLRGDAWATASSTSVLLLAGSGIIGIGIGDTAFFATLNHLGARRALLLEALAPPLAALLALVFLSEWLDERAYLGIVITVVGVAWVVIERTSDSTPSALPDALPNALSAASSSDRLDMRVGLVFGLIAALCQASGAVMSRAALSDTTISPLWSSLIRIIAGSVVLLIWMMIRRPIPERLKPLRSPRFLIIIAATAFASTFLAIWLQQTALKYTATGIAQALSATSPLFVIPIAALMGDRVSLRAIVGAIVALIGVWILFH